MGHISHEGLARPVKQGSGERTFARACLASFDKYMYVPSSRAWLPRPLRYPLITSSTPRIMPKKGTYSRRGQGSKAAGGAKRGRKYRREQRLRKDYSAYEK